MNMEESGLGLKDSDTPETVELDGLIGWVEGRYNRSKTSRESDEDRWLTAYRNYRGLYGPDVQFTEKEKAKHLSKSQDQSLGRLRSNC